MNIHVRLNDESLSRNGVAVLGDMSLCRKHNVMLVPVGWTRLNEASAGGRSGATIPPSLCVKAAVREIHTAKGWDEEGPAEAWFKFYPRFR